MSAYISTIVTVLCFYPTFVACYLNKVQSAQRRATKMVEGLENKFYEEWLRELGLLSFSLRF